VTPRAWDDEKAKRLKVEDAPTITENSRAAHFVCDVNRPAGASPDVSRPDEWRWWLGITYHAWALGPQLCNLKVKSDLDIKPAV